MGEGKGGSILSGFEWPSYHPKCGRRGCSFAGEMLEIKRGRCI